MENNKKGSKLALIFSILSIIFASILFLIILIVKLDYYDLRDDSIYWIAFSILISSGGMILIIIGNILIFCKQHIAGFALTMASDSLIVFNVAIEFIGILGAAMCLDSDWGDLIENMLKIHFVSSIPAGLCTASAVIGFVKEKRKAKADKHN